MKFLNALQEDAGNNFSYLVPMNIVSGGGDNLPRGKVCPPLNPHVCFHFYVSGWLGWAMVLGSFQCRGVLILLHIVGQGPTVLAAGVGRVGYIFFFIFHLSSLSNVLSFGETAQHD